MRVRIKKLFPLPACLLLVSLFTAGCRKPGLATTPASAAAPRAKTTFVYLAALQPLIKIRDSPPAWDTSPALIFAFVPDAITGRLGALAYFPIPTAIEADFIAHDPSNRFDYLADMAEDSIYAYAVNPRNGRLRAIPLSPFAAGREPAALAFTPNGKFLYVAYQALNAVGAYSVDSTTGALTPVPGSPFPTTGTKIYGCCVAVTPDGRYLVAGDQYLSTATASTPARASSPWSVRCPPRSVWRASPSIPKAATPTQPAAVRKPCPLTPSRLTAES